MSSGMYISTVLNLYSLIRRFNESPKFIFDVILGDSHITNTIDHGVIKSKEIRIGVWRGVRLKPQFAELTVPSLEAGQTVFFTLVKTKVTPGTK